MEITRASYLSMDGKLNYQSYAMFEYSIHIYIASCPLPHRTLLQSRTEAYTTARRVDLNVHAQNNRSSRIFLLRLWRVSHTASISQLSLQDWKPNSNVHVTPPRDTHNNIYESNLFPNDPLAYVEVNASLSKLQECIEEISLAFSGGPRNNLRIH